VQGVRRGAPPLPRPADRAPIRAIRPADRNSRPTKLSRRRPPFPPGRNFTPPAPAGAPGRRVRAAGGDAARQAVALRAGRGGGAQVVSASSRERPGSRPAPHRHIHPQACGGPAPEKLARARTKVRGLRRRPGGAQRSCVGKIEWGGLGRAPLRARCNGPDTALAQWCIDLSQPESAGGVRHC
jgi:hypothetical protein